MASTFKMKNWIILVISIIITLIGKFMAPIAALSADGNTVLFFMMAIVLILATETLPSGPLGIIVIVLLPVLGLAKTLNDSAKLFGSQLYFFILACYAIALIMGKLPLSKRILLFFLKKFGKTTKGTITAILLTTAILSSFISNFPACLLVFFIAKQYINMIENEADRKQTQRSIMVGIIIAVAIGGICTPVGSSCTILASTYLAQAGYPISFLQWICFGLPIAAIMFPAATFLLYKILPPVEQSEESRKIFIDNVSAQIPEKMSAQEILTLIILGATFICWVLNFNLMLVTCFCAIAILFPGFKLLSWKEFNDGAGWGTIMMVCALIAVVTVISSTGVMAWLLVIFNSLIPAGASPIIILLILGLFTAVIILIMPNGPVVMAVFGSVIVALATSLGIHPAVLVLSFAFFTTYSFTLPIDSLSLVIYDGGANFRAKDEPLVGIPLMVIATIATSIWVPICALLLKL